MVSVHPQSCSITLDLVNVRRPLSSSLYSVCFESHAIDICSSYFWHVMCLSLPRFCLIQVHIYEQFKKDKG